ncbi:MAG: type II toxin-antitoxin system MqsA family antitoxin [Ruminococcus sp.]|nr:type II toxin-antitoxin system MqsA family antitoxin [Ruminococcus sp.]MCM1381047.1 type II toxin-antitoxin system MqsA family antitoxin [Muribaculaceae bacterium]MCM1479736.1 type II toxin-antitoxin system MqsA family antitoxin [Muribaculaceae bacterium]
MNCFFCKGDMQESTTTYFEQLENSIVIIKNVPCLKCVQCGETAYTAAVSERIEEITAQLEKAFTEIAVVNYSAA